MVLWPFCLLLFSSFLVRNLFQNPKSPQNGRNLLLPKASRKYDVKRKSGTRRNKNGSTDGVGREKIRRPRRSGCMKFLQMLVGFPVPLTNPHTKFTVQPELDRR